MNKSDLTICVVDHGLFLPVALRLGREAKKVYYTAERESPFPSVHDVIGDGFEEVERVQSIWDVHDEIDLFVFPDVGFSSLQKHLLKDGHPIWGGRDADSIETMRGKFLRILDQVGLPVPEFKAIRGMNWLRAYLAENDDVYIKISRYRGDWETFHWRTWELDHLELETRALRLGPWQEFITYYVFQPIDSKIEDGIDTFNIDGRWPELCIHGVECKDKAFIATFQKFADIPEEMRRVNEAFGPVLAGYGYRGFFSTEVRITEEGESYFIDPTCRAGSPPHQVQSEMIGNYLEVIYSGANGAIAEPEPAAKFGVQAVVDIPGDDEDWRILSVEKELEPWIKPSMCSKVGTTLVFPPRTHKEVCWLTATGNTIMEAIENLKEHAELLPDGVGCEFSDLAKLVQEIHDAEDKGMEFTDQPVPEPEEVPQ